MATRYFYGFLSFLLISLTTLQNALEIEKESDYFIGILSSMRKGGQPLFLLLSPQLACAESGIDSFERM